MSGGNGTVLPASQNVAYGGNATILCLPDAGYKVAGITDNGKNEQLANPYVIKNMKEQHAVAVTFAPSSDYLDNWRIIESTVLGSHMFTAATYGNGTVVAVGAGIIVVSHDHGDSWMDVTPAEKPFLWGVAFGNGTFAAVGDKKKVWTSKDGANWTPVATSTPGSLTGITFANNVFVAVVLAGTFTHLLTETPGRSIR